MYRQCLMEKVIPNIRKYQTSWIPVEFAHLGKVVKLKDDDGVWDDGWVVKNVGSRMRSEQEVIQRSRDHKKQRNASDI